MVQMLGASVVDGMITFLSDILLQLNLDYLLYIFGGLTLLIILISAVRLIWCYEDRTIRAMKRVNKYLKNNPKINDDNLVEFHKKMKKLPRRVRDRWQLFMLEREGSPSRYMTVEYCVKRPLYNSAILMNQKQIGYTTFIIAILGFVFSLSNIVAENTVTNLASILLQAAIVPAVVGVLGSIYCMVLHLRYNRVNHDFYDMFTAFVRNIDKATNTMPDYVDYELLFTKKEIEKGIPVLREYLEKRAMEEQRLLEKAKREDTNHSPYDFSSLGVNGAQLIERAVNESEKFLINKINMQNEITDLEKQLQKTDQNMEDIQREANRKLQAIKENLERLDKAMSETTNRVEINYNRRQSDAEMNKKLLLEKDMQTMLDKEKVAADALKVEIEKRKEIIEDNKKEVEEALKSEYDTFATKVYDELNEKITRDNSESLHEMEMTIARLKAKVKEFTRDIEKKDAIIEARNLEIDNMRQQISRQKGKGKTKKEFGQDYIKVQENNPEGNINGLKVDMYDDNNYAQNADNTQNYNNNYEQATDSTNAYVEQNQDYNNGYSEQPQQYDNFDQNYDANYNQSYEQPAYTENYDNQASQSYDNQGQQNVDNQAYDVNADYNAQNSYPENYAQDYSQYVPQPDDYNAQGYDTQYYDNNVQPEYTEQGVATDTTGQQVTDAIPYSETSNEQVVETPTESTEEPATNENVSNTVPVGTTDDGVINLQSVENDDNTIKLENLVDNSTTNNDDNVINITDETATSDKSEALKEENTKQEEENKNKDVKENSVKEDNEEKSKLKPAKKTKIKKLTDEVHEEEKASEKEEKKEKDTLEEKTTAKDSKETEEKQENEKEKKKYADNDDLVALQKQIEEENAKLKKQQEELRAQIDKTLASMEKASNATKAERTRNIKKIKDLIAKLKVEAENAKARGASKAELNKINKSAAELLKVISEYQAKK